ncbi:MAG TPA: ATP-binding cassette domain-containing protein [Rhodocyclaceae bacterium]|nr:ATP-binding cassette domain-containing protein [Rhodocyclaceae bacterium]
MKIVEAFDLTLSPFPDAAPFDFAVERGEHWLLRGPSRAGKTPLIKTLCGMISPGRGRVVLLGEDLHDIAPSALLQLRRRIGLVLPLDGLMPAWSGYENLALPLKYHDRMSNEAINERIDSFTRRYQVPADWMDNPVGGLSVEKRIALSLIRALIVEPELLLIDAVPLDAVQTFSGIDGTRLIRDAIDGDCTVILSLPEEAGERLPAIVDGGGFRTAEMRGGRIECLR